MKRILHISINRQFSICLSLEASVKIGREKYEKVCICLFYMPKKNKCTHTKALINITKQGLLQGKKNTYGIKLRISNILCSQYMKDKITCFLHRLIIKHCYFVFQFSSKHTRENFTLYINNKYILPSKFRTVWWTTNRKNIRMISTIHIYYSRSYYYYYSSSNNTQMYVRTCWVSSERTHIPFICIYQFHRWTTI
jgi:hypothetical protein